MGTFFLVTLIIFAMTTSGMALRSLPGATKLLVTAAFAVNDELAGDRTIAYGRLL